MKIILEVNEIREEVFIYRLVVYVITRISHGKANTNYVSIMSFLSKSLQGCVPVKIIIIVDFRKWPTSVVRK